MVVIHIAQTLPLNPPGAQPTITSTQAWAALARKARRPQDFVPVVKSCTILGERDNQIALEVHFHEGQKLGHGHRIRETCTLSAPCRLDYALEDGSSAVNLISAGKRARDEDLMLTFAWAWNHEGVEEGSREEEELRRQHWKVAPMAVQGTIDAIRRMVKVGKL